MWKYTDWTSELENFNLFGGFSIRILPNRLRSSILNSRRLYVHVALGVVNTCKINISWNISRNFSNAAIGHRSRLICIIHPNLHYIWLFDKFYWSETELWNCWWKNTLCMLMSCYESMTPKEWLYFVNYHPSFYLISFSEMFTMIAKRTNDSVKVMNAKLRSYIIIIVRLSPHPTNISVCYGTCQQVGESTSRNWFFSHRNSRTWPFTAIH